MELLCLDELSVTVSCVTITRIQAVLYHAHLLSETKPMVSEWQDGWDVVWIVATVLQYESAEALPPEFFFSEI